ncbi:MAG: YbaB/EbfC family nucleoid-associated protein [Chloroflexia bacterium]|nr:YbaB/EbfC family nucleoid-associated protein [Chloroflexia bacterium]
MIMEMQNRMQKIQEELGETIVEGSAGGGMVTAQVNGLRQMHGIKISPDAVDPADVEMLEDMVLAAVQDAMNNAEELSAEKMGALTGGMKIPGLM